MAPAAPQATNSDVMKGLRAQYADLTQAQKRIAEIIVEDPQFVAFATVDKIAQRLNVSPSTVVRFAYKLGLSGYPELQRQVQEFVVGSARPGPSFDQLGDQIAEALGDGVPARSLGHDLENLERTISGIDPEDLDAAIKMLVESERVAVTGALTSFGLAHLMLVTLGRVRPGVTLIQGDSAAGSLMDLGENDVLVAYCNAPYARVTLARISAARANGASVIAITDSPLSPVRGDANLLLNCSVSGIGMQNSLVAPMALTNCLINGVSDAIPDAVDRFKRTMTLLGDGQTYVLEDPGGNDSKRDSDAGEGLGQ